MIHHRLIRSLARGRLWACDLLAAVPREEAASSLGREREARGWERDELRRQLDQAQGDLALMRAAAQQAANNTQANERRLVDQLQRLETALTTEQGLRASAERAVMEGLRASAERAVMEEQELAVQLRVRESTLREEVADLTKTRTKQRECLLQLRAELSALDQAARDVSAAAVEVELLDTAFAPAIAKLRDVLAARSAP